MISVVICSVKEELAKQVQLNIENTIGTEWEPIVIDNTINQESLAHVYNLGASMARCNLICFVHEDVLFQTQDWGLKLVEYFKEEKLGLLGVAGSKYKSRTASGWYTGVPEFDCCNIWHLDRTNKLEKIRFNPMPESPVQEVVSLDGVFMVTRKSVWNEVRFNEELLRDFHLYDLDFSVRISERYKVMVTFEVEIIHIVKGRHFGDKWLESTLVWHSYNNSRLPAAIEGINCVHEYYERKVRRTWLVRLKHEDIRFFNRIKWLIAIKIWKHVFDWPYVLLFLFKRSKNGLTAENGRVKSK